MDDLMAPPTGFAQWLKFERKQREWTLAEMADAVGVPWNTIARWERGTMTPSPLVQKAVRDTLSKGKRG